MNSSISEDSHRNYFDIGYSNFFIDVSPEASEVKAKVYY